MKYSLQSLLYAGIVLLAADCSGLITEAPLNAAAEVGHQTIFNCTSDTTQPNWIFSAKREDLGTSAVQSIVLSCVVPNAFMGDYEVERSGGSTYKCNLIIKAATMQLAGVYTCSDNDRGPSSILTVIERDPSITVSKQVGVVAGDRVTMSYTVRYRSSTASSQTPTMQPVLTWTDSDGKTIPSSETPGTNAVTSSISVTAERKDILPYTCRIFYSINGSSTDFASNTPRNVSTPSSTATIPVSYNPVIQSLQKSELVPDCPGYAVQITCDASAKPPAFYSWIGPDSRNYSEAKIEVEKNGVYTCTASNVINGSEHSDSKSIEVNVFSPNATAKECTNGHPEWTVIIIIIVVGGYILGNAIATVVFLIYYNRNIGFKLQLNDRFLWLLKMLPCMNENVESRCTWIFLSVFVFALVGIFFTILISVIWNCSPRRRHSKDSADQFHNPRDIKNHNGNPEHDLQYSASGPNGEDAYAEIALTEVSVRNGKDHQKQKSGNANRKTQSSAKKKNESPSVHQKGARGGYVANPVPAAPSLPPLNHQNQVSQPTHGPLYSDLPLPIGDSNVQPQQFIAGNMDNYSELKLA